LADRHPGRGSVLTLLACCALIPSPLPAPAAEPARLRVMSYNIHHGEGTDGRVDLARIAGVIEAQQPDLVALQEVDKGVARTQRQDFPAELARLTRMTCLFTNNFHYQGGDYGNAILTRFPVRSWTNTHLRMLRTNEQRGALQAVVAAGPRNLLFVATHIDFRRDDAERLANVEEFTEIVARYPDLPVLICGDFNDTPSSRTHRAMAGRFTDTWTAVGHGEGFTIPSTLPRSRIDYIWFAPTNAFAPRRAWVPSTTASDHLPVVAEFELPGPH
jgi:endonuclease/exonuclease/phosphatase family metal-dependent hydrolase